MLDLVSVIIPVYNSAKFLRESLESVISQTYQNIEIICVNDGSTDNSLEILKKYSDKITIITQENQGLASALNTGIKQMKGKWFKWFSPDDILYPDAIEILVNTANKLSENCIVYSNWIIIDEKGKKLREFHESNYNELSNFDFNVRLLDSPLINVNTSLIPLSLIEKGYNIQNLDNSVAVDYDFFLRSGILYKTKFHLIEKNLVKYRIHHNQLSHNKITSTLQYVDVLKESILSKLGPAESKRYFRALKNYNRQKSFLQKIMYFSLKIITKILPVSLTDKIILFYLNKVRKSR